MHALSGWTQVKQCVLCLFVFSLCLSARSLAAADKVVSGAKFDPEANVAYPPSHAVVDVTRAPYFAKGDGVTDDTAALERALLDVMGQHKLLYFPNGTYLVTRTLNWTKTNSAGKAAWGKNFLQGQNATKTIIRLKDATFTDATQPASIMCCGGFGSADWFHNYVQVASHHQLQRWPNLPARYSHQGLWTRSGRCHDPGLVCGGTYPGEGQAAECWPTRFRVLLSSNV